MYWPKKIVVITPKKKNGTKGMGCLNFFVFKIT